MSFTNTNRLSGALLLLLKTRRVQGTAISRSLLDTSISIGGVRSFLADGGSSSTLRMLLEKRMLKGTAISRALPISAMPALRKNWLFNVNNIVVNTGTSQANRQRLMYGILTALIGFPQNSVTMDHSCDGTNVGVRGDGVNWITSPTKCVWTGAFDSAPEGVTARSWFVLNRSDGAQICVSLQCQGSATPELFIHTSGSPSGTFGLARKGTAVARPKAPDEFIMRTGDPIAAGAWEIMNSGLNPMTFHILHSTDGLNTRVLICQGGKTVALWCWDTPTTIGPGWLTPKFTGLMAGSAAVSTEFPTYANLNGAANGRVSFPYETALYWGTDAAGGSTLGQLNTTVDGLGGMMELSAISLITSAASSASARGKHGELPDIWFSPTAPATGDDYPVDNSRKFAQFGNVVLPWCGVVVDTQAGAGVMSPTSRNALVVSSPAAVVVAPPVISSSTPGPLAATDNMVVTVTHPSGASYLKRVVIEVIFPDTVQDVVFSEGFGSSYPGGVKSPVGTTGYSYTFTRVPPIGVPGWCGQPTFLIHALDTTGNESISAFVPVVTGAVAFGPPALIGHPVVTGVTPAPGTNISRTQVVSLSVTDPDTSFRRIILEATFAGSDEKDVVHDGNSFSPRYSGGANTITAIAAGFTYTVLRDGGWPGAPTITPIGVDTFGYENT